MLIANYSLIDIKNGNHFKPNNDTILIQICDPKTTFPISPHNDKFIKVYQFSFLDTNNESDINGIKDSDATEISNALNFAKNNNFNVIVHCHAGICRSGAVVEAGTLLGFTVPDGINKRQPNTLVFNKIRIELGFLNSWELTFENISKVK